MSGTGAYMHASGGGGPQQIPQGADIPDRVAQYIQEEIARNTCDLWEITATRDAEMADMREEFKAIEKTFGQVQEAFSNVSIKLQAAEAKLAAIETQPVTAAMAAPLYQASGQFSGKREEFNTWISQILNYINIQPQLFTQGGDRTKVLFICGRMTGDAYTHIQAIVESSHTGTPAPELYDFNAFLAKLRRIFGPIDEQGDAQRKIRSMMQRNRTVEAYAAEFNLVAAKTGWPEQPLVGQFYVGLSLKICEKLVGTGVQELPYDELVRKAAAVDAELRVLRSDTPHRTTSSAPASDPNAMDIGPMRTGGTEGWQLAKEERERRRTAGLCYKCGKGRHQVRECRSPFNPNPTPVPSGSHLAVASTGNASMPPSESWTPLPSRDVLPADAWAMLSQALEIVSKSQDKGKGKAKEEESPAASSSKDTSHSGF